jgi:hypothetical protein
MHIVSLKIPVNMLKLVIGTASGLETGPVHEERERQKRPHSKMKILFENISR